MRSIIGRFSSTTASITFAPAVTTTVYLASADWMGRNLFRRIEVAWPVLDPELKQRVIDEGLKPYLEDTAEAWTLTGDGSYRPPRAPDRGASAQARLLEELAASVVKV